MAWFGKPKPAAQKKVLKGIRLALAPVRSEIKKLVRLKAEIDTFQATLSDLRLSWKDNPDPVGEVRMLEHRAKHLVKEIKSLKVVQGLETRRLLHLMSRTHDINELIRRHILDDSRIQQWVSSKTSTLEELFDHALEVFREEEKDSEKWKSGIRLLLVSFLTAGKIISEEIERLKKEVSDLTEQRAAVSEAVLSKFKEKEEEKKPEEKKPPEAVQMRAVEELDEDFRLTGIELARYITFGNKVNHYIKELAYLGSPSPLYLSVSGSEEKLAQLQEQAKSLFREVKGLERLQERLRTLKNEELVDFIIGIKGILPQIKARFRKDLRIQQWIEEGTFTIEKLLRRAIAASNVKTRLRERPDVRPLMHFFTGVRSLIDREIRELDTRRRDIRDLKESIASSAMEKFKKS